MRFLNKNKEVEEQNQLRPDERISEARAKVVEIGILVEQVENTIAEASKELVEAIKQIDEEISKLQAKLKELEVLKKNTEELLAFNDRLYDRVTSIYTIEK